MGDKRVVLGRVSGLFGVRGWVKVFSHTRPVSNLTTYDRWFLNVDEQGRHDAWRPFRVVVAKPHGKTLIAQLADGADRVVDDRDVAATLIGADIAVARADMPVLADGEFYWRDLLGLDVVNRAQERLGRVSSMMETGANDVLVIQSEDGGELLIPFVMGAIVDGVDLSNNVITVDWGRDY